MAEIPNPNTSVSRRPAALLTGVSRGIGSAIALRFTQSGCGLFLLAGKEQEKLEDCAALYRAAGARVIARLVDVSDSTTYVEVFTDFDRHSSIPNLLVANAGVSHLGLLQNMTPDNWDHVIRTDLSSCFCPSRFTIPRMLHAGSDKLIFLSFVWGSRGASCEITYSAAKGGANSSTQTPAKELVPSNIQINATTPGAIDTDINACLDTEEHRTPKDGVLAGRLGTAKEVAVLVCQLTATPVCFTGNILILSDGQAL